MSLATCVLKTSVQTFRLNVYGMGKSSEGVDFVTVHVDQLAQFTRVARGSDWQSLRLAFDGLLGSASFGKPYTIDGIEYVRIYNAPPRVDIETLRNAVAHAKAAEYRARKAFESVCVETEAQRDVAEKALNEANAETTRAELALRNAKGAKCPFDCEHNHVAGVR